MKHKITTIIVCYLSFSLMIASSIISTIYLTMPNLLGTNNVLLSICSLLVGVVSLVVFLVSFIKIVIELSK